jgi:hypothetical protein
MSPRFKTNGPQQGARKKECTPGQPLWEKGLEIPSDSQFYLSALTQSLVRDIGRTNFHVN